MKKRVDKRPLYCLTVLYFGGSALFCAIGQWFNCGLLLGLACGGLAVMFVTPATRTVPDPPPADS